MKKLIYLFILTLGIISCSSDDKTEIDNSNIIGKWNWTNTDGGIAFHIHETPESLGVTLYLILNRNYSYSILENGTEISNGTYQLIQKESNLTNELETFITYSGNFQQPQGIILSGMINSYDNNKLGISQDFPDGIGSGFEKTD
ncbi:hypothetical protein Q4Q34_07245 [Flavivirga abyssicola]|uniref:hypothetical protein n=1 Tax=Flavivirga abyssicola TaxID=3063533 RepID=UPI0026DFCFDD|nr:hypothetical protein [Flavivirga sp. MEBiC07777]WVK14822.1 hypothetical protein Q4Q34_07245 [Flavivirga sp. MEBiC07777]